MLAIRWLRPRSQRERALGVSGDCFMSQKETEAQRAREALAVLLEGLLPVWVPLSQRNQGAAERLSAGLSSRVHIGVMTSVQCSKYLLNAY